MAARRTLAFSSVDQVMPDVDRLLNGHKTAGNWSLGQICSHLTGTFQSSIEGFPIKMPWLMRATIGKVVKKKILASGKMDEGIKIPERFLPKPGLDDRAEAEALRAALRLYAAHTGPVANHPMFGPMSRTEWDRLHCIHCAHHLSFAHPNGVS